VQTAFNVLELPGQVTTHSLRKTFANHVLRASGGNIKVLQELLGHQNLSTTEAYLSFELDELRSAVPDFGVLDQITFRPTHTKSLPSNPA
jgi:site-specific recombinase XerD